MILTPRLTAAILAKRKRLHIFGRDKDTCPYSIGHSYAVQSKAGKKQVCRVKVTGIEATRLGTITDQQAVLNGFKDRPDLLVEWQTRFNITNELTPIWIVHFELDTEAQPRLLHRDSSHGYTPSPFQSLESAGEAVPEDYQSGITKEAQARDAVRRAESLQGEALALRSNIELFKAWALKNGVDARSELRVLERRLQEKLRKRQAA